MADEEIVVDEEFDEHRTIKTYEISKGEKYFVVKEFIEWNEDGDREVNFEVVEGTTEKENQEILDWIDENYDKFEI